MAKGLYTQGMAILFRGPVGLPDLRALLERSFEIAKEAPGSELWQIAGPTLVLRYRDELNGVVVVDTVAHRWPDPMGDPKAEPEVFAAWAMGHFGPLAYPRGLERAAQQAWGWMDGAAAAVAEHTAFVRVKVTYPGGPDAPVMPPGIDAAHELDFVVRVCRALLDHPAAICLYNPCGELMLTAAQLDERIGGPAETDPPPLHAWTHVRLFNADEPGWLLMDTVGNGQLELPDLEAAFPKGLCEPVEVDRFLRNATLYLLQKGPVVKSGDTMDGPGGLRWQGFHFEVALGAPPRAVLRWLPLLPEGERARVPARFLQARQPEAPAPERRGWLGRLFGGSRNGR